MSKIINNLTWETINWPLVHKRLHRQQRRIFKASRERNKYLTQKLQIQLINSLDAKLAAVQKVTTLNRGKNTIGVDRQVYTTGPQKIRLAYSLKLDGKAHPIKRTWIPKPGKKEKRPLGIPIIRDRSKQYIAKLALEPEWEALFEPNSYGFRPGRSSHDAIEAIFIMLVRLKRSVLDADITKCFDQVNHDVLLSKLNTFPKMENQIKSWLKAEIMDEYSHRDKQNVANTRGTPQGGIISPLLANIALHGLEYHLKEWYTHNKLYDPSKRKSHTRYQQELSVIRYADDFVIIHESEQVIKLAKEETSRWLKGIGLELSHEKTNIRRSDQGFTFLGHQCITITRQNKHRVKMHTSRLNKERLIDKIGIEIKKHKASSSYDLIQSLSRIIIGWGNYFKYSECANDFKQLNYRIYNLLRAWVFRRTAQNKGRYYFRKKYFPEGQTYEYNGAKHQDNWVLTGQTTINGQTKSNFLPKLTWIKPIKHVKVKGTASPFNGNHYYWAQRLSAYQAMDKTRIKLLKKQNGECPICKQKFKINDLIEKDHIIPIANGGSNKLTNFQLIHTYCHVNKTRDEIKARNQSK